MRYIRQPNEQIKALETFTLYDGREIEAGTLGGIIESPRNLAQSGTCWVFPGSLIEGNAYVSGDAVLQEGAQVIDEAKVYGHTLISGGVVMDQARVLGDTIVQGNVIKPDGAITIPVWRDDQAYKEGQIVWNNGTLWQVNEKYVPDDPPQSFASLAAKFDSIAPYSAPVTDGTVSIPPWSSETDYAAGQLIWHNGRILQVDTPHLSSDKPNILEIDKEKFSTVIPYGLLIKDQAVVSGEVSVLDDSVVGGNARVQGSAIIRKGAKILDDARVTGKTIIEGCVKEKGSVSGCTVMDVTSVVQCDARLEGCAKLRNTVLDCNAVVAGDVELVDETVDDASLVTNCPEKKKQTNCCPEEEPIP